MTINNTKCAHCGTDFKSSNPRKIYCSKACKSRAYEQRNGIDAPRFLLGEKFEVIEKEISIKVPNPQYIIFQRNQEKLLVEIENLKKTIKEKHEEIAEQKNKIEEIWQMRIDLKVKLSLKSMCNNKIKILNTKLGEMEKQLKQKNLFFNLNNYFNKNTPKEIRQKQLKKIKVPVKKITKNSSKNEAIMTAEQLLNQNFKLLNLNGDFNDFLGAIAPNTFITITGPPGSGKSTLALKISESISEIGLVLYNSLEEGFGPTLQQRLNQLHITSPLIHICEKFTIDQIRQVLQKSDYAACIIDSINKIIEITPEAFESLRKEFPEVCFVIILQSNKDGSFKGSNEYAHNSDINIKAEAGKANTHKNRFHVFTEYQIF